MGLATRSTRASARPALKIHTTHASNRESKAVCVMDMGMGMVWVWAQKHHE
jgi:hypothetical protein